MPTYLADNYKNGNLNEVHVASKVLTRLSNGFWQQQI